MSKIAILFALFVSIACAQSEKYEYRVLATNKTSTMEKEMNAAAGAGYSFSSVMGGETAFGGKEVVVVMAKKVGGEAGAQKKYKLLATARTSTMQKEMQQAANEGFEYCGQTVFESTFGGKEVSIIMERDLGAEPKPGEYKLLATARTSTMDKELRQAGEDGFMLLGLTVGKTAMGGSELVCILRRPQNP